MLSQRLDLDCPAEPIDVYRVLRTINPSPYMYYLQLQDAQGKDFAVVGSSPETLVKLTDGRVVTFPIAGSRPRGATPEEDRALHDEVLADPKERAEHIMLVDLSRNDLAKVCEPTSVEVVEFMAVKRYSHIMHICSTVIGRLRAGATALQTLVATFPAGTLSGAPKPRAIALIDEIEPARRGIYGGTVGYFDFAGDMDMAIAIRTALIRDGRASVQAGGGIVADSVPALEYAESRNKATAAGARLPPRRPCERRDPASAVTGDPTSANATGADGNDRSTSTRSRLVVLALLALGAVTGFAADDSSATGLAVLALAGIPVVFAVPRRGLPFVGGALVAVALLVVMASGTVDDPLTVVSATSVVVSGLVMAWRGRRWPAMAGRFGSADATARVDFWRELDRGRDPTAAEEPPDVRASRLTPGGRPIACSSPARGARASTRPSTCQE